MTVEEVKARFGNSTMDEHGRGIGYVYCSNCPLNNAETDECPDHCSGYDNTWEAIAKFMSEPGNDPVTHPAHYTQGGVECIDAMVAAYGKEAVSTFCLLNAFKYLWRSEHKNGKQDLEKAIWYLKKRLELTESE